MHGWLGFESSERFWTRFVPPMNDNFFHVLQRYDFHVVKGLQKIHVVHTSAFHVLKTSGCLIFFPRTVGNPFDRGWTNAGEERTTGIIGQSTEQDFSNSNKTAEKLQSILVMSRLNNNQFKLNVIWWRHENGESCLHGELKERGRSNILQSRKEESTEKSILAITERGVNLGKTPFLHYPIRKKNPARPFDPDPKTIARFSFSPPLKAKSRLNKIVYFCIRETECRQIGQAERPPAFTSILSRYVLCVYTAKTQDNN